MILKRNHLIIQDVSVILAENTVFFADDIISDISLPDLGRH